MGLAIPSTSDIINFLEGFVLYAVLSDASCLVQSDYGRSLVLWCMVERKLTVKMEWRFYDEEESGWLRMQVSYSLGTAWIAYISEHSSVRSPHTSTIPSPTKGPLKFPGKAILPSYATLRDSVVRCFMSIRFSLHKFSARNLLHIPPPLYSLSYWVRCHHSRIGKIFKYWPDPLSIRHFPT